MRLKFAQESEHCDPSFNFAASGITAKETGRLEMDAFDDIHVFHQKVHHLAEIVVVDAANDRRHQSNRQPGLLTVADSPDLLFKKRLAAQLHVYIVTRTVELHEDHARSCITQDLRIPFFICQSAAVRIYLDV